MLLVTDATLQANGLTEPVRFAIDQTDAECLVFADGEAEPSTDLVSQLCEVAAEFQPDLFVAVGGGSNMDLAKVGSACHTHRVAPETVFGFDNVPGPVTPLVCLPTTAGTGSEVSHAAVLRSAATGQKAAVLSQYLRAEVALVDPQLTLTCPSELTAASGIDALAQAIEAFLVSNFYGFAENLPDGLPFEGNHPLGDMYAEKAIRLIGENWELAHSEPDHLAARSGMALAATLAGVAFSSCGVSLVHALEFPIGAKYERSHGVGIGVVLPAVMEFWLPARQPRLARIARLLGLDCSELSEQASAKAAIQEVERLREAVGLPTGLRQIEGSELHIEALAEQTADYQLLTGLSPEPAGVTELISILRASL